MAKGIFFSKIKHSIDLKELKRAIRKEKIDRQCRRIGFGGCYDRLLVNARVPSIALAYEGQLVDQVPADESQVYRCIQ
ncbi:hypothetical protein HZA56_01365 [Candidatus Poribacteria bacterium]|nr:hypothetical protein [Candidatus Poribacteria bacterium]